MIKMLTEKLMPPLVRVLLLTLLFATPPLYANGFQTATFAGGCFWCVEDAFDGVHGVVETTSGYANGHIKNPTYEQVSAGDTGYYESVKVKFDPEQVTYRKLLDVFWHNIDPTDNEGQFCDRGLQYRSAIFYENDAQRRVAKDSLAALRKNHPFKARIVTAIEPLEAFYPAEKYHQNYHQKNPIRYRFYKYSCGRTDRLEEVWGK